MPRYSVLALSSLLVLAACGGGGGYGSGGGGGGGGGGGTIAGPGPNVATVTVENFQAGFINMPYVSVTVCQPGTTNCMTIDHVEVDTGSWGLRILSTAGNAAFLASLPQQFVGATTNPVVECAQFADGFTWGPVVSADVSISSEKASGIPIHVIGAPAPFTNIPSSCSSIGNPEDTVQTFGANGVIGVGVFAQDCGSGCVNAAVPGTYYSCPTNGAGCTSIAESLTLQVANPVAGFVPLSAGATPDNNGVIVEMPGVPAAGAATATGALVFGIGTQSNNGRGTAQVLTTNQNTGLITVTFQGTPYDGILDSGSNAYFFPDSALTVCSSTSAAPGFFCTPANVTATLTGTNGAQVTANFTTGDANAMITANPTAAALPQIAGPSVSIPNQPPIFALGMPFFYGRNVFAALEGAPAGGATGPYFAY